MPCYDGRESERQVPVTTEDRARLAHEWMHNSPVAEMLCYVLSNLPQVHRMSLLASNVQLATWWGQHVERDRKKARREQDKAYNAEIDNQIAILRSKKK